MVVLEVVAGIIVIGLVVYIVSKVRNKDDSPTSPGSSTGDNKDVDKY